MLQGESAECVKKHQFRLTASNFVKVNSRIQRPSDSKLKSIFCPKDLSNIRAVSHGKGKRKDCMSNICQKNAIASTKFCKRDHHEAQQSIIHFF